MADRLFFDGEPVLQSGPGSPQHILLVDGHAGNLDVNARRLGATGFAVTPVNNAAAALVAARFDKPDLLLIDWNFADGNAATMLRTLRADPQVAELPIMVVTPKSDNRAAVDALAAGADDYLAKPYDFELLLARIRRLLSRSATLANLRRANAAVDGRTISRAAEINALRDRLEANLEESRRLETSLRDLERRLRRGSERPDDGRSDAHPM